MTRQSEASPARLFTAFGTVLFVDGSSGELRHGPVESSPANAFFEPEKSLPGSYALGRLIYLANGSREPIDCFYDVCLTASQQQGRDSSGAASMLESIPLERGLFALRAGGHFLSAIPDGRIMHRADVCSTWELFIASENWCTDSPGVTLNGAWRHDQVAFNKRNIASHIVHPLIRMRSARQPNAKKILFYGYPKWSHGRVYYDLSKHLHERGYLVDILDWQQNHSDYAQELVPYYDFIVSALDGISTLADAYKVPFDKIIAISHHEFDMRMLIERKGMDIFDKFANYGVVSESLYSASAMLGIVRSPMVVPLGVDTLSFFSALPERLTTVGYSSSLSVTTYGLEWKRGKLAEAAARDAGLAFKVAGSTANQLSFHDMPDFYRSVDAVVSSSVNESGPLSVLEGAAAGRLVISTPVGHFPLKAYSGGGLLAPIEPKKFVAFTSSALRYYKDNPAAFSDACRSIRDSSFKFDWIYFVEDWINLIENPELTNCNSCKDGYLEQRANSEFSIPFNKDRYTSSINISREIHLVNLDRSVDRLSLFRRNNPHVSKDIVRFAAIDGVSLDRAQLLKDGTITEDCSYKPGSLGCALSHINLWKLAVAKNKAVTIFEDDIYVSLDFSKEFSTLTSIAGQSWDLIKWGFIFDPLFVWLDFGFSKAKLEFYERRANQDPTVFQKKSSGRSLVRIAHSFGLQAYTVTPRGAQILIDKCLPLRKRTIPFPGTGITIDDTGIDCVMCAAYGSMRAFVCMPPLVIPDPKQVSDRVAADDFPINY
ncbi:putative glycosyl transferase [Mesorhizobium plurifarium]|uniref:Putative glycosyl transferase n=1 Tax=Mesorhizobium plurifarium TaxID=69974 RepID=A0A090FH24_MESPL|nr:putative glycosyl transferase [Mesorhizobium plurifarium]